MYCLSGGQENSGGHVRRSNKRTEGWIKHSSVQTHLKTRRGPGHTRGPKPERHVSPLHVCTQKPYTSHTYTHTHTHTQALISVSIFLPSFPLSSKHSHSLARLMTQVPPIHTQNLNLQNKTQRASGCVFFPEAPRRLMTQPLRKCNHDWNVRNPEGLGLKSKYP